MVHTVVEESKTSLSIIDILKDKIGNEKLHNTLIMFDLFKIQGILLLSSFFTGTDIFTKGSQKVRHRQVSIILKKTRDMQFKFSHHNSVTLGSIGWLLNQRKILEICKN